MEYSRYLMGYRKEQILNAYENLPEEKKRYTLPQAMNAMMNGEHELFFPLVSSINQLVLSGKVDFNKDSPLEKIVKLF